MRYWYLYTRNTAIYMYTYFTAHRKKPLEKRVITDALFLFLFLLVTVWIDQLVMVAHDIDSTGCIENLRDRKIEYKQRTSFVWKIIINVTTMTYTIRKRRTSYIIKHVMFARCSWKTTKFQIAQLCMSDALAENKDLFKYLLP